MDDIAITEKHGASLSDAITKRAAEHAAKNDPAHYHPLIGSRYWPLDDAALEEAFCGAEITHEIRLTDSCTLIAGHLGKSRGYEPFLCARTDGSAPHTMICPGMEG